MVQGRMMFHNVLQKYHPTRQKNIHVSRKKILNSPNLALHVNFFSVISVELSSYVHSMPSRNTRGNGQWAMGNGK